LAPSIAAPNRTAKKFLAGVHLVAAIISAGAAAAEEEALPPETASFQEVASRAGLDPPESEGFLVSFAIQSWDFPPPGERANFITKFESGRKPNAGWAIAFRQFETSLRSMLYWRDERGRGGWQFFDPLPMEREKQYCITLIAKAREFAVLFFQPLSGETGRGAVQPLGGLPLEGLGIPRTSAPLIIGESRGEKYRFRGKISHVLIARLKHAPSTQEAAMRLVDGCSTEIAGRLEQDETVLRFPGVETEKPVPRTRRAERNGGARREARAKPK
jgi:hypothetical protein